jgi:hypothetical protein
VAGRVPVQGCERQNHRAGRAPAESPCRAAEDKYGLRRTAPADRTAARRPKRGETEKARRLGRAEASRTTLRRMVVTAAAGARDEKE